MAKLLCLIAILALTASLPSGAASLSDLPKLVPMATAISQEAVRGEWTAAHKDAARFKSAWVAIRPAVATTRLQTAHAETIDASIAWMMAAIDQKHTRGVQDSATFVVRTVNHLMNDHNQR
jgi:hypothetical protein